MAEFALGLTKTAVEGTLSRVKSAIGEETKLRVLVQNDLVFITGEFQMMQSFLNVASKERAKNEVVRTWVRQVRNLAFDVEDCVEFVVHLDSKSPWGWVRRLWHTVYCRAPPLPLDVAVAEIKLLKARVEDVSMRNTRYNLIGDSGSSSQSIPLVEVPNTSASSAFHLLREVWETAGKQRGVSLKELIARESIDLQVFSVWGSAGGDLGRMSIYREVYTDPNICKQFDCRAWVKLKHPFHPDEFLETLLTQFYPSYHQAKVGADDLLKARLKQHLKKHKYLVILEEVSTVIEWEAIKKCFPDSKNGSRIIVSTQQLGTALLCTGELNLVSELRRFSDGQSLCVFFRKVSGCRSDMGELKWHLLASPRGVYSVYGSRQRTSLMVRKLFRSILEKKEEFDGLAFRTYRWVRVVHPFDLRDFSRRLFMDLRSWGLEIDYFDHTESLDDEFDREIYDREKYDHHASLGAVMNMKYEDLIEGCRKLMQEEECLIAINCLESTNDWDLIKSTILLDTAANCRVIVITEEKSVAEHCVENVEDRILHINDPEGNAAEGCLFSSGREDAHEWIDNFELIGHEDEGCDLTDLVRNPGVVSVWGIAGVGKSALTRHIYCHLMLGLGPSFMVAHSTVSFPNKTIYMEFSWVDVPHPFNLTDFSRRLLLDFHSNDLQAKEAVAVGIMEGQDPIQWSCRLLRERKCLVVIDGLRSTHDWDIINATLLPEGSCRSCIVVIAYEAKVATHCVNKKEKNMVNIKGLEPDEALILFKKTAWGSNQLTDEDNQMLAKCGGLPKVIDAIAKQWWYMDNDFMGKLETDQRFHSLRGLFSWMKSYFDASSDSLKPCIFYLSVFPVGHNIRWKRLLRRWIAEGYARDRSGSTAEENGEMFFCELVKLSIIQLQQPSCKALQVNGFFREYIISRPMEDNLVFALEGCCILNSQFSGQHLTIRSNWDRDKILFESIDFSRLRSLTVFGEWKPFFISPNVDMRLLRVLDLEDTYGVTDTDLEKIGEYLSRLKFLSLRGCKDIKRVPKSFGGLRQLQTLDVRGTSIVTLPYVIMKLEKLKYIRAGITIPSHQDWISTPQKNIDDSFEIWTSAPLEGMTADHPTAMDEIQASIPPEGITDQPEGMTTDLPAAIDEIQASSEGMITDLPAAADEIQAPAPLEGRDGTTTSLPTTSHEASTLSRPRALVSFLSKFCRLQPDSGVQISAGIGKLMALHTLGVVNVSGAGGKTILKELKTLTQLRKLRFSGINSRNIKELCSAISGHRHLESLSVWFDKDKEGTFVCLDDFSQPPRTIKSLKLYGHVHGLPVWMKQFDNLIKLDLEMTIQTQDDLYILNELPRLDILRRLCIKPTIQAGELRFHSRLRQRFPINYWAAICNLRVLKIDCSSSLEITFERWITSSVELLIVHCSLGSCLRISGLVKLYSLKEVWLKGSYGDATKKDLQGQIGRWPADRTKPLLMLEKPPSS